jgi:hypothetical protein
LGKPWKDLMREKGITWCSTESDTKAANAEVAIRELKRRIYRYMTHGSTLTYIDVLPDIVSAYNRRVHPKTGFPPNEVNEINSSIVFRKLYPNYFKSKKRPGRPQFSVGDRVRIAMEYSKLRHGYLPGYSEKIYEVSKVLTHRDPVRYKLKEENEGLIGSWYDWEMIKARDPPPVRQRRRRRR